MTRLSSYYSNSGMFNELTDGLEYYRFLTNITNNFDEKHAEVSEKLAETAQILFNQNNMIATITCSDDQYSAYSEALNMLSSALPEGDGNINEWKFDLSPKNEGLMSASKVQYVTKGYDFKELGYEWNGKMRVLNQILSRDWLQKRVRVMGGAYGGFAGFSSSGQAYFASYRDPNLTETLENYDATPTFLNEFDAKETEMTRFIIGTISRMDRPTTASQRGSIAVRRYFTNTTLEELKAERSAVLGTKLEDIKNYESMIQDILDQDVICVYGNEDKIKDHKDLFNEIFNVTY
jgi:Zn-dependent M16 (insulinase) family peptidase